VQDDDDDKPKKKAKKEKKPKKKSGHDDDSEDISDADEVPVANQHSICGCGVMWQFTLRHHNVYMYATLALHQRASTSARVNK
jgi:hypothetical protein